MGTTADKLNYLLATKDEIKAAITAKGVDVSSSTFRECAQKIREIPQEINVVEPTITKGNTDVRFLDYDGTLIHSFTKEEFLALTEMPTLPSREGLICQGWNYTIEDAKAYVSEYGVLDVGATYITDDGKTRLYITIATEGRQDVPLYISQTIANGVTIDWGDGSATETLSGTGNVNTTHHYNEIGDYVISLDVADGCTLGLGRDSSSHCVMGWTGDSGRVYCNMLKRAEIGNGVTSIENYALSYCFSLASAVIPQGVTKIGNYAFFHCYSLTSVVIPQGVTSIGYSAFTYCYPLSSVVIPQGVTSIESQAFQDCSSLPSIVIPQSVTKIGGNAFSSCYSLPSVVIPQGVTSFGSYVFSYCYSLASVVISQGVTSIGNGAFYGCRSLPSVVIPQGVTIIVEQAFYGCHSLSSVVIPRGVTRLESHAFGSCYGIAYFDFRTHTSVPTLLNYNAFSYIASDCKIVVPDVLYDEWIAAESWSDSSVVGKIIKASDFESL